MKILLAVDGSDYTRKMLAYVRDNKTLFDDSHEYTVLHVQPQLPPHVKSTLGASTVNQYHEEEAQKVLVPAVEALQQGGLKARSQYLVGPAGETIGSFADKGSYDMVIMGSHGHGALARLVMGSVTSEVLARCGVPVLLIR
jgi:nucleotide-binding universal stress UspA family protein